MLQKALRTTRLTGDKSAVDCGLGVVPGGLLLPLDVLRLEVHPEAGQGEDFLRPLLALGDLPLLLARRRQRREPLNLVHVGALEGVVEPVRQGLHRRQVVDASGYLSMNRQLFIKLVTSVFGLCDF